MDKLFKEFPNAFGTAYEILVEGYTNDTSDYDRIMCKVSKPVENLKLNTAKYHVRCISIPFGKISSRQGINPYPTNCML